MTTPTAEAVLQLLADRLQPTVIPELTSGEMERLRDFALANGVRAALWSGFDIKCTKAAALVNVASGTSKAEQSAIHAALIVQRDSYSTANSDEAGNGGTVAVSSGNGFMSVKTRRR